MRLIASVGIALAIAATSLCQPAPPPANEPEPRLEYDGALVDGIQYLTGAKQVQALRWEGGTPVIWFNIQEEGKPRKVQLDVGSDMKRFARGRDWNPRYCSGWVLVRISPAAEGAKTQDLSVVVVIDQRAVANGKSKSVYGSSSHWTGAIPLPAKDETVSFGAYVGEEGKYKKSFVNYHTHDGKTHEFMEVTLPLDGKKK